MNSKETMLQDLTEEQAEQVAGGLGGRDPYGDRLAEDTKGGAQH